MMVQPKNNDEQQTTNSGQNNLDTNAEIGIYARQSTPTQGKNCQQSTEMQISGLVAYAKQLGWSEEAIIEFTQDSATSGSLRIDQREGLRSLIERIVTGQLKTVLVFQEDRLFRDPTGIEYNIFIQICRKHDVKVITNETVYDFSDDDHVKRFRLRCEIA